MADAPKEKQKKRKSEVKKSELPAKSKGTAGEDTKEKSESRKSSQRKVSGTPETVPDAPRKTSVMSESTSAPVPGLKAQSSQRKVSGTPETVPEAPRKTSVISESISASVPDPKAESSQRKVSGTPETVPEAPRKMPESASTPVPVLEVESAEEKSVANSKPVPKAVEIKKAPEPPKATVEQPERRASYVAPRAATKRDVDLLYELDEQKLLELREAFHLFDLNNDGFIDKEDLRNTYITLGKTDIDDNEIQHMLSEAINPLDFDSFVVLLGYKTVELDPEEVLLEALSQWDYDESGLISEERIKHDLMMWGDKFTPEEVDVALEDAPVFMRQNTPMIDYIKFCKILCGLRRKSKMPQPGN